MFKTKKRYLNTEELIELRNASIRLANEATEYLKEGYKAAYKANMKQVKTIEKILKCGYRVA